MFTKKEYRSFLSRHDMIYEKEARKWEQGVPMGNGLLGTVVWGGGEKPLRLSLDRADVWELRNIRPDYEGEFNWRTFTHYLETENRDKLNKFLISAVREDYTTKFVKVQAECGGHLILRSDFGCTTVHVESGGTVTDYVMEDGILKLDTQKGEELFIWAGEEKPEDKIRPLEGIPTEYHFYGVKRIARF